MALRKIISFQSAAPSSSPPHPNDYRFWGNDGYVAASNTRWVKFWVSWAAVQPNPPASLGASWGQLNSSPVNASGHCYMRELDMQIRAAKNAGLGVILTVYHAYPLWSNGNPVNGQDSRQGNRQTNQKIPLDLSTNSPFGWFIQYLCARYSKRFSTDGVYNDPGPGGATGTFGNPERAWVDVLEPVNEPNLLLWPQEDAACAASTMMDAAQYFSYWASDGSSALPIAGPATSDDPDPGGDPSGLTTDWRTFTSKVLDGLANWRPQVYVVWSHHNYRDIKYGPYGNSDRAKQVVDLLYQKNWRGGGDRNLWITEGGYDLGGPDFFASDDIGGYNGYTAAHQSNQANAIASTFNRYLQVPEIATFCQHTINDFHHLVLNPPSQNYGLRDEFAESWNTNKPSHLRAQRAAYSTWQNLGPWAP